MAVDERFAGRFAALAAEAEKLRSLKDAGGGGTSGGMDAWQGSVEARLAGLDGRTQAFGAKLDTDFRVTWGGIIVLGLLGIGGFAWMINLLFQMQARLTDIQGALTTITSTLAK